MRKMKTGKTGKISRGTDLNCIDFQRRGGDIDSGRTGTIAEMRVTKFLRARKWKSANDYTPKSKI